MKSYKEFIQESSLTRLKSKSDKGGVGYISASRADKSGKENQKRTSQLSKDIRGAGLPGPTKVEGQYKEAGQDKPSKEKSFAVTSGKQGKRRFKKNMKKLGKKYEQDSVLVQQKGGGQGKLKPSTKAGKKDLKGWDGKVGKMKPGGSGDMQTRVKGKTFTYE